MAGISSSIQLADRMTPVLQSITNAMSMMVNNFSTAQTAVEAGFNPAQAVAMQQAVINASAELAQYQENLERARNTPVKPPEAPTWNAVPNQPVFMSSGAERFEQEYQAANAAAQQLYKQQQAISAQARTMKVIPPGMINDVAATSNRVQSLSLRVQELNSIPVDLRTDRTNNELESLRQKLSQAAAVQEQLSTAMGKMDISAANAAYQQLNSIVDSTERGIRDNLTAQEQFNQSIQSGITKADGLGGTIKRYAALLISAATAGKAISLADQVTQTTARLDLMNQRFEETGNLQQKIYESAQRSRGVYQSTADAVSKLGMQASGAFANTDEVVAFAEQLNKTFVIAGTSAQGVDSVMLQLTQSMAAGKLQGEELNAVLDNAQPIVQNIADYMGVPVGKIKELASKGVISAEIIKNAMFAAADETNAKFMQMPMTFGQVANNIKNQALMAFQPALQQLSAVTQTEGFQNLVNGVLSGIQMLASGAVQALDMMGQAAMFVQENLWWLVPVIGGVAAAVIAYKGAVLAYNIVQGISNILKMASVALTAIHTTATLADAKAHIMNATNCSAATAAQWAFNASLLACPLTWIVIAIIAVIAVIAIWVNRVGSLRVAWLICVNGVRTKLEQLKLGFINAQISILNTIDNMVFGFNTFRAGVLNALGNIKAQGLMILQNFINGAINKINSLIAAVNSIAGVSIAPISVVAEFGTRAVEEEARKQQQRASDLAAMQGENAAKARSRQTYKDSVERHMAADRMQRLAEIAAAKNEAASKAEEKETAYGGGSAYDNVAKYAGNTAGNTGNTAANTAAMADTMDVVEEDLKYMRDAAEQEIINRFTLAELKIDVNNHNTLKTQTDFNDVNRMLGDATAEILATAAEGGYI